MEKGEMHQCKMRLLPYVPTFTADPTEDALILHAHIQFPYPCSWSGGGCVCPMRCMHGCVDRGAHVPHVECEREWLFPIPSDRVLELCPAALFSVEDWYMH